MCVQQWVIGICTPAEPVPRVEWYQNIPICADRKAALSLAQPKPCCWACESWLFFTAGNSAPLNSLHHLRGVEPSIPPPLAARPVPGCVWDRGCWVGRRLWPLPSQGPRSGRTDPAWSPGSSSNPVLEGQGEACWRQGHLGDLKDEGGGEGHRQRGSWQRPKAERVQVFRGTRITQKLVVLPWFPLVEAAFPATPTPLSALWW